MFNGVGGVRFGFGFNNMAENLKKQRNTTRDL